MKQHNNNDIMQTTMCRPQCADRWAIRCDAILSV